MTHLQSYDPEQMTSELRSLMASGIQRGAMHVRFEKGDQVGTRLADDEVVDIEQLGDSCQWRLAILI